MRDGLGTLLPPEAVALSAWRRAQCAIRIRYLFTYVLLNPFRVFVTVNDPSARAEILM